MSSGAEEETVEVVNPNSSSYTPEEKYLIQKELGVEGDLMNGSTLLQAVSKLQRKGILDQNGDLKDEFYGIIDDLEAKLEDHPVEGVDHKGPYVVKSLRTEDYKEVEEMAKDIYSELRDITGLEFTSKYLATRVPYNSTKIGRFFEHLEADYDRDEIVGREASRRKRYSKKEVIAALEEEGLAT